MQAHVAHTSSIHLTFGERHHHDSSVPVEISLQFSLFAEEVDSHIFSNARLDKTYRIPWHLNYLQQLSSLNSM